MLLFAGAVGGGGESKAKYVLLDGKRLEKSIRVYV